ncbi:hypothetical protein ACWGM5_20625 [Bacillus velezensis]
MARRQSGHGDGGGKGKWTAPAGAVMAATFNQRGEAQAASTRQVGAAV